MVLINIYALIMINSFPSKIIFFFPNICISSKAALLTHFTFSKAEPVHFLQKINNNEMIYGVWFS